VLRAWVSAWTDDRPGLRRLAADGFVSHSQNGADLDIDGLVHGIELVFTSFPDLQCEVVHVLEEGDLAAAYVVAMGTHLGPYLGLEATGERTAFRGTYHCRVDATAGRVLEDWEIFDLLTPAMRLGLTLSGP